MGRNYRKEKAKQRGRMQAARMNEAHGVGNASADSAPEPQESVLNNALISPQMFELSVVAESAGYVVIDVPGDGDCMFAAVCEALQHIGLHYSSQQLRQMVAAYLKDHPFVNGDTSNPRWNFIDAVILNLPADVVLDRQVVWKLYLEKIAKCYRSGGIWGDEMALKACSEMLEVKIQVYRYDGVNYQPYGCQYNKEIALGYVMYEGEGNMRGKQVGEHYCAFIKHGENVSVGNRMQPYRKSSLNVHERTCFETTTFGAVGRKVSATYAQKCKTVNLTQPVSAKNVRRQVPKVDVRKKQMQEKRRSVNSDRVQISVDVCSHKTSVVDSDGYQLVHNRKRVKKVPDTNGESSLKNVKKSARLDLLSISTHNRFESLMQEPVVAADDDFITDACQPSTVLMEQNQRQCSTPHLLTLDQQPCDNEETVTDHQNITQRILQQREMARMRQQKKRRTESNEQAALRRQKALENVRSRLSNETEENKILRRQKALENTRRRVSNETEEERILRRQKLLHNVRLHRMNETVERRHIRLQSSVKRVRQRLLVEDSPRRMKRLQKCRSYMLQRRHKLRRSNYRAKLSTNCIRLKMLMQERLLRQSSALTAAQHAITRAWRVRVKAAAQKTHNQKRHENYWKKVNEFGEKFQSVLKGGLCCVCMCCHRLLYRRSVRKFDANSYSERLSALVDRATSEPLLHNFERNHICFTCHSSLRRGRLPAQSKANGLVLDDIPDQLKNLTTLERHIISRRIPFMKLISLPRGKQLSIHGPTVNVPTAVVPVMSMLPRTASDDSFLPLKLKRKLTFRGHYMYGNINVQRVNSALQWLMSNNELYVDVSVTDDWQKSWNELDSNQHNSNENNTVQHSEGNAEHVQVSDHQCVDADTGEDIETAGDEESLEANRLRGIPYDTCLQREDDDDSGEKVISVAPGEEQRPIGILQDRFFEEMAFPDKFPLGSGGIASKIRPVSLTPRKYFQQRILDVDGRFSADTDYLFAAQYAIENKQLRDNISIMLRQTKGGSINGRKVTASVVRDAQQINSFVRNDQAFRCLTTVRGSPAYWKRASMDLLAMIRQLGIPTWFMTLSAADLQWPDVIQIVARQYGECLSDEQICNMSWEEKCSYIRRNPVAVARHYDFRLKTFFKEFLTSDANPVGNIAHYFYRIEFQQRGSPHVHMLLWVSGAPVFEKSTDHQIRQFVDRYQTCAIPANDEELKKLVLNVQKHSHSKSCRMKDGTCRFSFPHIPLDRTIVARGPLSGPKELLMEPHRANDIMKEVRQLIDTYLQSDAENVPPLTAILAELEVPEHMYEWAVSTTVTRKKVCLQRTTQEMMINSYCPAVLKYWKANMDIQFVIDAYACVVYITSYMMKDERNLSELLIEAARESADSSVREQLNKVGSCFLNHREVSAQEAVYRLLSLHLKESNCSVVFVNTSPPETRVSMLRPYHELVDCDSDDEDVFKVSLIDRYAARPEELESMCLADFASDYVSCTENYNNKCGTLIRLINSAGRVLGYMRRRRKSAVIRFPSFKRGEESYFRSKLMLFIPWRNETEDLCGEFGTFAERCVAEKQKLQENVSRFVQNGKQLEQAFADLEKANRIGAVQNGWDEVAPLAVAENYECEVEGNEDVNLFDEHVILFEQQSEKRPAKVDNYAALRARFTTESNARILSDEEYIRQMESLNIEQKKAVLFNKRWCNEFVDAVNNSLPRPEAYHLFLSGPGGVGKSHVIRLVHTDCMKLLRSCRQHGEEMFGPDEICVLLTAPTGTAAFNIGGLTLHSALFLNPDNCKLSADKLNTLQTILCKLTVLIIDEISMVGSDFLIQIDKRLRLVKGRDIVFGGVSVLAVGDLYQLPPVRQTSVFSLSRNPICQLQGSVWQTHFQLVELTQNMRQRDQEFAELLNRIRVGICTEADEKVMSTRILPFTKGHPEYPIDVTHIFGTNRECLEHNIYCLERTGNEIFALKAVDSKMDKFTKLVNTADVVKDTDIGGLKQEFRVSIGARVMLVANLDIADGLANGATGTVRGVVQDRDKVVAIQVQFDNSNVGQQAMKVNPYCSDYPNCVCVARHSVCSSYGKGKTVNVTRSQFPLCLAFACTIHKVQGMTMDKVVMSMKSRFFPGQAYVALSRVKTIQGLHLLDFDKKKIICNKQVSREMDRLRQRAIAHEETVCSHETT